MVHPTHRFATTALLLAVLPAAACGAPALGPASPAPSSGQTPSAVADPAEALQDDLVSVIERVSPSVVQIQDTQGLGSGVIFDTQGDIVTNAHVVAGADSFTVTFADGTTEPASLLDAYAPNDLAVLRLQGGGAGHSPATFADSSKLRVGDMVLAIGNPLGLRSSVTDGIVSAVRTGISEGNGVVLPSVIQTSAAINPGNSGGALVDLHGDVVGIPTLAAADPSLGSTAPGIGFAIPSNTVRDLADQIVRNGRVVNSHRAYLGVQTSDAPSRGAVIVALVAGGPAAGAGLVPGDVITSVAGTAVLTSADLAVILAGLAPGDRVDLKVTHAGGSTASVTVTLGTYPGG
jgi:putative serine protease PepD